MIAQGVLPFQYQGEKGSSGMTALSGLPVYLDLMQAMGLRESIRRHVHVRGEASQGWKDEQIIPSLILLNLAGGDCVDDLRTLESDEGFCRVLKPLRVLEEALANLPEGVAPLAGVAEVMLRPDTAR